jgi:ankyrin repeat protein
MSKATPLMTSAGLGEEFRIQDLIRSGKAGDVNQGDAKGWTALHVAVSHHHIGCVRVLLHDGKANVNVKDRDGTTPLHVAASNGDNDIVVLLLQAGAHPSPRNSKGDTPLILCCENSSPNSVLIAQNLLASGASVTEVNGTRRTPLHLAARAGNEALVRLLLSNGADPKAKDNLGMTPVDFAEGNPQIKKLLNA